MSVDGLVPVRLNEFVQDPPEVEAGRPNLSVHKCDNCFHGAVCSVARAARDLGGVVVGMCAMQMPIEELAGEAEAP